MRRLLPLALGLSLAVAAVALAILAVQTWRYPSHAAAEDRSLTRRPIPATAWAEQGGIAQAVLGAADDATFRHALALFLQSRPDEPGAGKSGEQVLAGLEAAIALAAIVHGDPPVARRRSRQPRRDPHRRGRRLRSRGARRVERCGPALPATHPRPAELERGEGESRAPLQLRGPDRDRVGIDRRFRRLRQRGRRGRRGRWLLRWTASTC